MHCANPDCCACFDQPGGSLWMMELETLSTDVLHGEDNGFPVSHQQIKYFWLCVSCSEKYVLHRWTPSGIVLLPISTLHRQSPATHAEPLVSKPPIRFHACRRLETELLESA